ncbi:MAG TPA: hypothetical protein VF623_03520 [Segetibacter sp.]
MFFNLFNSKKLKIKRGDSVLMKKEYKNRFPSVPTTLILKIVNIEQTSATVLYCNNNGTDICQEKVSIDALTKVN